MDFLDRADPGHGEEPPRVMATVAALLAQFPGDMDPVFASDVVQFAADTAARLAEAGCARPAGGKGRRRPGTARRPDKAPPPY